MRCPPNGNLYLLMGFLATIVTLTANLHWSQPSYNWDIVAYIGSANAMVYQSPEVIHERTFKAIKEAVPDAALQELYGRGKKPKPYRVAVAGDPEIFRQQLPFYLVKPLYPALMLVFSEFGFSLVDSSILISRAAYLCIGILIFFWISRYCGPGFSFLFSALVMSTPFSLAMASLSTPDALSTAILLLGFYLYVETERFKLTFIVLLLSIAARPDNLILFILLLMFSIVANQSKRQQSRWFFGFVGIASIALYIGQSVLSGNYGWETLFHHSYKELLLQPATEVISIAPEFYIEKLMSNSKPASLARTQSYSLVLFILLCLGALRLQLADWNTSNKTLILLLVNLLYVGAHWVLFPSQKERMLGAFFIFTLLALFKGVQIKNSHRNEA